MNCIALLLAASSLGVDFGWQPTADGELEYIIQIEPALLDAMRNGEQIVSEIHPDAAGVRRFRILVGRQQLPREAGVLTPRPPASAPPIQLSDAPQVAPPVGIGPVPSGEASQPKPVPRGGAFPSGGLAPPTGSEFPLPQRDPFNSVPQPSPLPKQNKVELTPLGPPPQKPDSAPTPIPDPDRQSRIRVPDIGELPRIGVPAALSPDPASEPLSRTAAYLESETRANDSAAGKTAAPTATVPSANNLDGTHSDPAKPWLPLMLTSLGLFGSIGLNVYLAWIARGFYTRYRALVANLRSSRPATA